MLSPLRRFIAAREADKGQISVPALFATVVVVTLLLIIAGAVVALALGPAPDVSRIEALRDALAGVFTVLVYIAAGLGLLAALVWTATWVYDVVSEQIKEQRDVKAVRDLIASRKADA